MEKERALTEEEIKKLDEDAPGSSSSAQPTTFAPEGASMQEVEAGMLAAEAVDGPTRRSTSRTRYAEGGSLAQFEREKKAERKAERKAGKH